MKLIEIKCKNCNSPLKVEDGKTKVTCDYCHSNFIIDDEIKKNATEIKETIDIAKKELQTERKKGQKTGCIASIIIAIVLFMIIVFIAIDKKEKPELELFDYFTLTFSGNNGEGTAEASIKDNEDGIVYSDFNCGFKEYGLSNNEKIKVTCSSLNYKLLTTEKIFEVTGLNEYLHDVNNLSDTNLNIIHKKSEIEVDKIIKNIPVKITSYDKKYVKTILLSDQQNTNKLFDIYGVNPVTTFDPTTIYEAIEYDDVIAYEDNINYKTTTYLFGFAKIGPFSVSGFQSIDEIEQKIKNYQKSDMKLTERS